MDCTSTRLPYRLTGAFSKIAMDYIDQAVALKPFYTHAPTIEGIKKAIIARKQFSTNRTLLVEQLTKQYAAVAASPEVQKNIESLLSENTFTITTAHQNNIFTGPLYFIYKILHAIKLADHLTTSLPEYKFVPVFYMGSEDADLDELNHIHLHGERLTWNTQQTGAVGRMKVDKELIKLIDLMEGQLAVLTNGKEIISLLREVYKEGVAIQEATFHIIHTLFADYGLLVLIPDNAALKKSMIPVFEDDLLNNTASKLVEQTAHKIQAAGYKAQATPRAINLFYLKDNKRERIELQGTQYAVLNSDIHFSKDELLHELNNNPERFSPNVILRGLFQETILPNIIFIGGGGELAYWLELKELFEQYKVPYPVQVLRNSFLIVEKKMQAMISKLGFTTDDFFLPEQELINRFVNKESDKKLQLNGTLQQAEQLYTAIKKQAVSIDVTLEKHVDFLKTRTIQRLQELEKKMLKAEKRKFADQQRQIQTIRTKLFPGNGLQERYDNVLYYYSKWGKEFIDQLYKYSLSLEGEFVVLNEV